jgi:hypothetical protein
MAVQTGTRPQLYLTFSLHLSSYFNGFLYISLLFIPYYYYYYYGSTTFNAKFWPSQPVPSIVFYPGQGFSNLALLTSVYFFLTLSSQRVFDLPVGLFEMGFQGCTALTILVSGILSIWPSHPSLCALAKFIMSYVLFHQSEVQHQPFTHPNEPTAILPDGQGQVWLKRFTPNDLPTRFS